ncbi:hypothetical protein D7D52_16925 [Nocardia yunnanensis]|uniref:Single-stranded DNA-binding protein n=1 Tax=Nocardia yunnanensis TaxID=2382165 RepID=A0A386ZDS8_9NOCA|nr:hypothetical protein [Nocardia yunnanensis]AYF75274.1 hypothetical protein D7D52_16925 [Nocardia yunnanensis]
MSTIVKGNIAKISDPVIYEATPTQAESMAVYVTIIDNHQRRTDDGGYTDTGSTTYEVRYSGSMAMRVLKTFDKGDPVSAEVRNLRTEIFTSRKGEPLASIRAFGIDLSVSCRYREIQIIRPDREDHAAV